MKLDEVGKPIINLVLLRWDNPPLNWVLVVSVLNRKHGRRKEALVLFLVLLPKHSLASLFL